LTKFSALFGPATSTPATSSIFVQPSMSTGQDNLGQHRYALRNNAKNLIRLYWTEDIADNLEQHIRLTVVFSNTPLCHKSAGSVGILVYVYALTKKAEILTDCTYVGAPVSDIE